MSTTCMEERHQELCVSLRDMNKLTHKSFGESMRTLRNAIETTTQEMLTNEIESVESSNLMRRMVTTVNTCMDKRREMNETMQKKQALHCPEASMSLDRMSKLTEDLPLLQFRGMLKYVPRLVNVVTLAQVQPKPGSSTTLPLALSEIARRCPGAFFSPKRFAAVQLAFRNPRCRVLIFHTGKIVGTGCSSIIEARLAALLACQHMQRYAGVELYVNNFEVVNTMGAVALQLTLDCERFQRAWSSMTMLDRSSFVGMTWRPSNEPVCIEIYSSGRANVSKARHYSQLLLSFSRLIPELLKYSSYKNCDARAVSQAESSEQSIEYKSAEVGEEEEARESTRPTIHTVRNGLLAKSMLSNAMIPLGKKRARSKFEPEPVSKSMKTPNNMYGSLDHTSSNQNTSNTSEMPLMESTSSIWDGWTVAS